MIEIAARSKLKGTGKEAITEDPEARKALLEQLEEGSISANDMVSRYSLKERSQINNEALRTGIKVLSADQKRAAQELAILSSVFRLYSQGLKLIDSGNFIAANEKIDSARAQLGTIARGVNGERDRKSVV